MVRWWIRTRLSGYRPMILIYIDPGAGSMVIQAMLAAVHAIPFFFRTHIARVIGRFRRQDSNSGEDDSQG